MSKPLNRVGVIRQALEQVTASRVRTQKSKKHIDKLMDDELTKRINAILKMQLVEEHALRLLLEKERERARV